MSRENASVAVAIFFCFSKNLAFIKYLRFWFVLAKAQITRELHFEHIQLRIIFVATFPLPYWFFGTKIRFFFFFKERKIYVSSWCQGTFFSMWEKQKAMLIGSSKLRLAPCGGESSIWSYLTWDQVFALSLTVFINYGWVCMWKISYSIMSMLNDQI